MGLSGDKSFEDQILNVSRLLAEEYWEVHNGEIFDIIEGYDVLSIRNSFLKAVLVSTTYAIYSRLTGDLDGYYDREDFRYVFDFRTSATTFALGTAVSMLLEGIFREIDATIRDYNRSHTLERSEERSRATLRSIYKLKKLHRGRHQRKQLRLYQKNHMLILI